MQGHVDCLLRAMAIIGFYSVIEVEVDLHLLGRENNNGMERLRSS